MDTNSLLTKEEQEIRDEEKRLIKKFQDLKKRADDNRIPTNVRFTLKKPSKADLKQVKSSKSQYLAVYKYDLGILLDASEKSKITKMGNWEFAFIMKLSQYIAFPSNQLLIDNFTPTVEQLGTMMDCKKDKIYEILRNLEHFDVIKKQKMGRNVMIYFNPFIFSSGIRISSETYNMFRNSVYYRFDE